MTKGEALYGFFSGFGIPAYEVNRVPVEAEFPYLTYDAKTAAFGEPPVSLTVNLWFHTEDNTVPDAKADEIGQRLGRGGAIIRCADGAVWLRRGEPFYQALNDPTDSRINRRFINITAEFITTY